MELACLGVYTLGVYTLGVYSLGLPISDLDLYLLCALVSVYGFGTLSPTHPHSLEWGLESGGLEPRGLESRPTDLELCHTLIRTHWNEISDLELRTLGV